MALGLASLGRHQDGPPGTDLSEMPLGLVLPGLASLGRRWDGLVGTVAPGQLWDGLAMRALELILLGWHWDGTGMAWLGWHRGGLTGVASPAPVTCPHPHTNGPFRAGGSPGLPSCPAGPRGSQGLGQPYMVVALAIAVRGAVRGRWRALLRCGPGSQSLLVHQLLSAPRIPKP